MSTGFIILLIAYLILLAENLILLWYLQKKIWGNGLKEDMTKLRYTSSITGEPYAEIGTDEPSEEEWDRFLEKKGMKRRDKSRFTKTDVKSICELSNELIRYRQGYAFMANMIVNISAGKEDPPILLDFLPDDEHARFVHRTIREWGEEIYKNKNDENNPDGETESTGTKEGNSRFGELRTMNQFMDIETDCVAANLTESGKNGKGGNRGTV